MAVTMTPPSSVKKVAIVGTGIIGSGWAALFCSKGYTVVAFVRSPASEVKFLKALESSWKIFMVRGLATDPEGYHKVKCVFNLAECVSDADYVQESVVEDVFLKQQVLQDIDQFAPPNVIIGSSTSFLPLSLLKARAKLHPERIATAHPWNPQWDAFCEVMGTSREITDWLATLFGKGGRAGEFSGLGMDVVTMKKEVHGHVLNTIFENVFSMSAFLVNSGVCEAAELDVALDHFSRLVVAGGGLSGLLCGIVGGGSAESSKELMTDIFSGAPVAWGSVAISWALPSPLAKLAVFMWVRLCYPLKFLKGFAGSFLRWWARPFYDSFEASWPDRAAFNDRALKLVCMMEKVE